MKPIFEQTPSTAGQSFHCEVVRAASYNAMWHFHPELQITLAIRSRGHRLVGDKITPLESGDMVLLGPNLPHVWHQDPSVGRIDPGVHAIIVRFSETFAGRDLLELPEATPVRTLFKRATRGLEITGPTRLEAAGRVEKLPQLHGLARVSELLSILDLLAHSRDLKPIASVGFVPAFSTDDHERMQRIIAYINAHLCEPIGRNEVAEVAHLSVSAFSRFFKLRTGMSLPEYLNELRVGRACHLLADERLKITNLAMECGYPNLANFNRRFRNIMGMSPREYRLQLRENSTPVATL